MFWSNLISCSCVEIVWSVLHTFTFKLIGKMANIDDQSAVLMQLQRERCIWELFALCKFHYYLHLVTVRGLHCDSCGREGWAILKRFNSKFLTEIPTHCGALTSPPMHGQLTKLINKLNWLCAYSEACERLNFMNISQAFQPFTTALTN